VERLRRYVNSIIELHLIDGQVIRGRLVQVDDDLMNIFLENCVDLGGRASPAAVVMGSSISHISIISLPTRDSLDEQIFQLLLNNGKMTVDEIAKILDTKPSSVKSAILRLKKKGLLVTNKERQQKGLMRESAERR
jgi:small nuclear ribonucleoprotein (snRNP)-like protein